MSSDATETLSLRTAVDSTCRVHIGVVTCLLRVQLSVANLGELL